MNIAINKDIEKYQETIVMGLTAKQLICSIVSVVVGGAIVLGTYKIVGLTGAAYVAIPAVAPIALNGFYTFQEMSFMEMMTRKIKIIFNNPHLLYVSEESEETKTKLKLEEQQNNKLEEKNKKKNQKKKR